MTKFAPTTNTLLQEVVHHLNSKPYFLLRNPGECVSKCLRTDLGCGFEVLCFIEFWNFCLFFSKLKTWEDEKKNIVEKKIEKKYWDNSWALSKLYLFKIEDFNFF